MLAQPTTLTIATSRLTALCWTTLLCCTTMAQEEVIEKTQEEIIATFTVPATDAPVSPRYPRAPLARNEEALIEVNFMVDQEGNTFDLVVDKSKSIGGEDFQKAALEALNKTRFKPAMLDGQPIIGSARFQYIFSLEDGGKGASRAFIRLYRDYQKSLEMDVKEVIEESLAALEERGSRNHYENAFLNMARYTYAVKYGNELEQMKYLHGALSYSDDPEDPVHYNENDVPGIRRVLLSLQLKNNYFADALKTYELMRSSGDDEAVEVFKDAIQVVREIEFNDTRFSLPFTLDESGYEVISLFKHNVAFLGGEGGLAEMKLRCSRKYVAISLERELSYNIPDEWGDCSAEIIGDPGANFMLLQH